MNQCLFSIIIPMFNAARCINETLYSIYQSEDIDEMSYEIICVDDASTDNTCAVVKSNQSQHKNLKLIENEKNCGCSYSRNRGIDAAIGEYIAFVDSDDLIDKNMLSKLSKEIRKKQNVQLIAFNADFFTPESRFKFLQDSYYLSRINKGDNQYLAFITNLWCCVIERKFLVENKIIFDEKRIFEDWLFLWHAYSKVEKCIYIDESLYFYRVNFYENTLTTQFRKRKNDIHGLFSVFYEAKALFNNTTWNKFEYVCLIRANEIFLHFLRSKVFSKKELQEFKNEYKLFLNSIPESLYLRLYKPKYGNNVFMLIDSIKNNGLLAKIYNPNIKIENDIREIKVCIKTALMPIIVARNYFFNLLKLAKKLIYCSYKLIFSNNFFIED